MIAWTSDGQDGSGYGVFAQLFDADGAPQATELQVNTYITGAQSSPSVASDDDGDFVIAWNSDGQDGSSYGIFARRFDAAGAPQGVEFRVNTYITGSQSLPAVSSSTSGDFVVAWTSFGQDGFSNGVFAQRFDAAGAPQGVEFRVNSTVVKVSMGELSVRHGPLPCGSGKHVLTCDLKQLFCTEKTHRTKNGSRITYNLEALLQGGKKVQLLTGLERLEQALYVEQQVEQHLHIPDERMPDEVMV